MQKTSKYVAALFFFVCSTAVLAQSNFYLKPNDRVVFYGDSITDQRLYTTFTETFIVTRFPKMPVTFIHSGWGGDRVTGGGGGPVDLRLKRDVIAYNPTVMTIMLGMNDGSYRPFDQNIFNTYATGMEKIVKDMKAADPGIRITLIQPSPYDDVTRKPGWDPGYNNVLVRYGGYLKELAGKESLDVADLNTGVVAALQKANAADPANAAKIVPDRVHPGPGGHLLMAEGLLKAWHAPATVSEVEMDATHHRITRSTNTHVSNVHWGESVTWDQLDNALPMPMDMNDPILALSVRSSDFVEALNEQPLRVLTPKSSRYTLKIDGQTVGSFSSDDLAHGVNLAALNTPMQKQAAEVHKLTLKRSDIHNYRWRNIQVPMEKDPITLSKVLSGFDAADHAMMLEQRAMAQPKAHHFELAQG